MSELLFSLAIFMILSAVSLAYHLNLSNRYRNTVEEFPEQGYKVVYNEHAGEVVITDEAKFDAHMKKLHKELLDDLRKQGIYL